MKVEEAAALLNFAREGVWVVGPLLEPPLLLNAAESARFLGVSADTFLRVRAEHQALLRPLETHQGGKMWAKNQLIAFANSHLRKEIDATVWNQPGVGLTRAR
jgi:hypothetical protein